MVRWHIRDLLPGVTLTVALGVAAGCGGQSVRTSGDAEAGDGGTTSGGTGGVAGTLDQGGGVGVGGASGSLPTGGTGSGRPCVYGGRVYEDGTGFRADDGCNTCHCSDGSVSCTLIDCPEDTCSAISQAYQESLDLARRCQPNFQGQCQMLVASSLQCGCPTYVQGTFGRDALEQLARLWSDRNCGGGVTCGACPPPPISGYCLSSGACVDSYRE